MTPLVPLADCTWWRRGLRVIAASPAADLRLVARQQAGDGLGEEVEVGDRVGVLGVHDLERRAPGVSSGLMTSAWTRASVPSLVSPPAGELAGSLSDREEVMLQSLGDPDTDEPVEHHALVADHDHAAAVA